jgi:hypothetical protein
MKKLLLYIIMSLLMFVPFFLFCVGIANEWSHPGFYMGGYILTFPILIWIIDTSKNN